MPALQEEERANTGTTEIGIDCPQELRVCPRRGQSYCLASIHHVTLHHVTLHLYTVEPVYSGHPGDHQKWLL